MQWVREIESLLKLGQDIDVYIKQVGASASANFRPTVSLFKVLKRYDLNACKHVELTHCLVYSEMKLQDTLALDCRCLRTMSAIWSLE